VASPPMRRTARPIIRRGSEPLARQCRARDRTRTAYRRGGRSRWRPPRPPPADVEVEEAADSCRGRHLAAFSSEAPDERHLGQQRRASSPSAASGAVRSSSCAISLSLEPSFCRCYLVLPCTFLLCIRSARLRLRLAKPLRHSCVCGRLPFEGASARRREAAALPEDRHDDRETHRDLGRPRTSRRIPEPDPGRPVALAEGPPGPGSPR